MPKRKSRKNKSNLKKFTVIGILIALIIGVVLFYTGVFDSNIVRYGDDDGTVGDIEELDDLATKAIIDQRTEQSSSYDRHYVTFIWDIKNTQYSGESYYFLIDFCTKSDFSGDCFRMKASNTAYHNIGDEYTIRMPIQIINNFENPTFCGKDLYVVASHYVCSDILGGGFCYEDGYPSSYGSEPIHWECAFVCDDGTRECTGAGSYKICQNNDWSSSKICPSYAPSCSNGNCEDSCSTIDCNDNNICTKDVCSGGKCSNSPTNEGTVCATGKACSNGNCITKAECSSNSDCNDNKLCTTDVCTDNECSNTAKLCEEGYSCNEATGNCEKNPTCSSNSDCNDNNECTEDACNGGVCDWEPILGCGLVCRAYQEYKDGKCTFSITKLFTGNGIKDVWEDFTYEMIAGIVILLIIIVLIIVLRKPKAMGGF